MGQLLQPLSLSLFIATHQSFKKGKALILNSLNKNTSKRGEQVWFFFHFSKSKFDVIPNPVYQQNDEPLEENSQPIERKNVVYNEVNDDIVRSVIFVNKMSFSNFNQYIRIMKIRLFYL